MKGRIALVIGSLLFSLLVLELGCRLLRGPSWLVHWPNLVLQDRMATKAQGVGRLVPDQRLGFVATPGFAAKDPTYDAHGWRGSPNPHGIALAPAPILGVGESRSHAEEVA